MRNGIHLDSIVAACSMRFMGKSTVPNQTIISLRLTPQLAKRLDEWWKKEVKRESGIRTISRNEVIAKLIDAGLVSFAKEQE